MLTKVVLLLMLQGMAVIAQKLSDATPIKIGMQEAEQMLLEQ